MGLILSSNKKETGENSDSFSSPRIRGSDERLVMTLLSDYLEIRPTSPVEVAFEVDEDFLIQFLKEQMQPDGFDSKRTA